MDAYILILFIIGVAALSMAWLPRILRDSPLSYPMVYLLLGAGLYGLPFDLPIPRLREESILHVTELSVIITLMGTGAKIDRVFSFRQWQVPFRLVSITMLLCIAIVAVIGTYWLGLSLAAAVLLGAVLAPTDPVLADDVQVGPPQEGEEDEVRFSLTAEAGLNDGTAFPFTWLAVLLAGAGSAAAMDWGEWAARDLLYRIVAGVAIGYGAGRGLAYLIFELPQRSRFPETKDNLVAISATLGVYGLTELLHGYGFIAVFVTGLVFSSFEKEHEYHKSLHEFSQQVERLLMVVILILLGGSLARGLLNALTWPAVALAVGFLFVIRPLTGWLALLGTNLFQRERIAISFFGIRGVGSFFYLAFALSKASFDHEDLIWSTVGLIVAISVIIHGITATPVMRLLDMKRNKQQAVEPEVESIE
ncbi:NhaP-type Na+/H+ or K+/H+ antiporter [Catalinimonas alkaloidigena]|uniref:NhaP-type Na+/H+ or K+/H+ antiporter n=1 Tax=Catalinimonas alkaloidigena TaxID=1075417 RepID=A0A1G9N053_9BACT|nr:cation:proton antiporter [Catalinimonas alkaloidigena]SDL79744.1 NhaP-type Na+/H+ or K+/H+ antiporter [Catalinimonas alkaloidigena]